MREEFFVEDKKRDEVEEAGEQENQEYSYTKPISAQIQKLSYSSI